jgi:hypothetical protein
LAPQTVYILRLTLTSTYSRTTQKSATSEFSLFLQTPCYGNKLAKGNTLAHDIGSDTMTSFSYKIGPAGSSDGQMDLAPLYSTTEDPAVCPLTATLLVWDDINNVWVDQSASTSQPWIGFLKLDDGSNPAGYF